MGFHATHKYRKYESVRMTVDYSGRYPDQYYLRVHANKGYLKSDGTLGTRPETPTHIGPLKGGW